MSKIALIGAGPMGIRHLQAIKNLPDLALVGLVDLNPSVLDKLVDEMKIPASVVFTNHLEMLLQQQPDLVIIATNGPSHFSIFQDIVNAGVKKILCEKPIATSVKQARAMIEIAHQNDVMLQVNHARRWSSDYIELKRRLDQGVIGEVESIYCSMGGGQMACNGTHMIDLASFLFDRQTKQVVGFLNDKQILNPRGEQFTDPGGYAVIHFEDHKRMFFEMTDDLGIPPIFIISGTYGRVVIEELKRFYTIESRKKEDRKLSITRYGTQLSDIEQISITDLDIVSLCQRAIERLMSGDTALHGPAAVNALETVIGVHFSNKNDNKPISLPILDEQMVEQGFSFT
jgi:predicted dehydrogenase